MDEGSVKELCEEGKWLFLSVLALLNLDIIISSPKGTTTMSISKA